ncbi:MAG TPA: PEP-CTERM sorting domain-containing protein [Oculatellaceae cyanobacterium]
MSASKRLSVATAIGLSLSLLTTSEALAYTFTRIADSNDPFGNFGISSPGINNEGTVAFQASLDAGGFGIFTNSNGIITTIADTSGPFSILNDPAINDQGTVVFNAFLDVGANGNFTNGIFSSSNGVITTIADASGPFSLLGAGPSINNEGTVAFGAFLDTDTGSLDLESTGTFTSSNGVITTIADTSGSFGGINFYPDINDEGTVVFLAYPRAGGQGIFTSNGGATTTIADSSGPFSSFGLSSAINNNGTVAFTARLDSGVVGIFTGSGAATTTIADTNGLFDGFIFVPEINNAGTVAFVAFPETGGTGIFTGPDPVSDKVIATGDTLLGSTVTSLNFEIGLNDEGQIAFGATLADGTVGIFRADPEPVAVPEPTSILGVLVAGALGAASRRKRM